MTSFKRKISTVALAASIALISGTAAAERGVTDTSIKIGNIGPFSGKAAMFNPLNYGSVAYMRYINDMGGIADGVNFTATRALWKHRSTSGIEARFLQIILAGGVSSNSCAFVDGSSNRPQGALAAGEALGPDGGRGRGRVVRGSRGPRMFSAPGAAMLI